jgi:hypothetical protein
VLEKRRILNIFVDRLVENGSQAIVCRGSEDLYRNLELVMDRVGLEPAAFYPREVLRSLPENIINRLNYIEDGMNFGEIARFRMAVTGVDYAVAESGSLVIFTESVAERLVTCFPEAYLGVVWAGRILPSLIDLNEIIANGVANGKTVSIISGPSRTLDVEQTYVRGVHGPDKVIALIVVEE